MSLEINPEYNFFRVCTNPNIGSSAYSIDMPSNINCFTMPMHGQLSFSASENFFLSNKYTPPTYNWMNNWNIGNSSLPNFDIASFWSNVGNLQLSKPEITCNIGWQPSYDYGLSSGNIDSFTSTASTQSTNSVSFDKNVSHTTYTTTLNDDKAFDKMLDFVLKSEGGYNPDDCGQAGNKGILQSTYDRYCEIKKLPHKDVKEITNKEVRDIYYTMYYVASGADKISDTKLALYVFDTAVNMGVSRAQAILKESGNNTSKFKELRLAKYELIATNDPSKAKYLNGWRNRVANVESFSNRELLA